jgi:O-acetylhomoserine/O-acetylserine sulfhydrylase-like pyridoxal-dependent enzyme
MAAMTVALLCQLSHGDHVVAGRAAFGSCRWLVDQLLPRFGIASTTIDARDNQAWVDAIRPNTKVFFFETPANPTMDIVDLRSSAASRASAGSSAWSTTPSPPPALQRPLEFGADVVAYSATKLMDGQGRVLAGAVCGTKEFINDKLLAMQRHTGPNLSPFNAWVVLKGLETLDLRVQRQSENALKVGRFLEGRVPRINFPACRATRSTTSRCSRWTPAARSSRSRSTAAAPGARGARRARADRHLEQHRRFALADVPQRLDHALLGQRRGARGDGRDRGHAAAQRRPRGSRRPDRGPRQALPKPGYEARGARCWFS